MHVFTNPDKSASRIAFSPDARMLVFHAGDIFVREIDSDRQLVRIPYPENGVVTSTPNYRVQRLPFSHVFLASAPLLAQAELTVRISLTSAGGYFPQDFSIEDETVSLWDTTTGQRIAGIKRTDTSGLKHPDSVLLAPEHPLLSSPDGTRLAQGDLSGRVWIMDVRNRRGEIIPCGGEVLDFLSNDELLIMAKGCLWRWNLTTKATHLASPHGASYLATSSAHRVVAFRSRPPGQPEDSVIVWDTSAGKEIGIINTVVKKEAEVLISNDGRFIAIRDPAEPNLIQLWKLTGTTYERLVIALPSNIKISLVYKLGEFESVKAAFSPDGSLLAATGDEGGRHAIWFWETETGRETAFLRDNELPVWSGDGRLLATTGSTEKIADTSVKVWSVTGPTPTYLLPASIESLTFNPDGKHMMSGKSIWDVVTEVDRRFLRRSTPELPGPIAGPTNGDQLWSVAAWQYPIRLYQLAPEQREITLEDPGYGFSLGGKVRFQP